MKSSVILLLLLLTGCAHKPQYENCGGANPVFEKDDSRKARIKQVFIGSEIKSSRGIGIADFASGFKLDWVESESNGGIITLGHFVLKPNGQK